MAGQRGVPHRRDAGLAVGLVLADHQQLVDAAPRDRARRMIRRLCRAPRTSSRCWPSPGRSRRGRPRRSAARRRRRARAVDRALAQALRKQRLDHAQHAVERAEEQEPAPALMRRLRRHADRFADPAGTARRCRRRAGLFARGFSASSTSSGTITVRAQYEILSMWNGNHLGSSMISTGITGTARHGTTPNSASRKRVKTLLLMRAAARAGSPRAPAPCAARRWSRRSSSARNRP